MIAMPAVRENSKIQVYFLKIRIIKKKTPKDLTLEINDLKIVSLLAVKVENNLVISFIGNSI